MSNLSEAVSRVRANHCEGCRNQFSREEIIEEDKKCDGCKRAAEIGRTMAGLKD